MQKKALLRKLLHKHKIEGILITDLANVRYLTGFTGSSGFAVITARHAILATDFRYQEQVRQEVKGWSIKIERTERSKEIKDICEVYNIRRLGFEDHNITYGFYGKLIKRRISLKPLTNAVESLRIIKSPAELSYIKASVKRAETAFRKLIPFIKAGTTERKLALKLEELLKLEGCKRLPFEVIVAAGFRSALPHAKPSDRRIKKGDLIVFDWGGEFEGYFSDMTRTVLIRGVDISKQKEIYHKVLEAQKRAIEAVSAGIGASVVDAAARDYIKQQGYDEYFGHGTGHGVGLAVHEKPVVSWRSKDTIEEDMIFTIEPGIYLPGFGGVRIEDMIAVRKNRAEVLTSLPKKLKIIEV
ncbi:MAG: aminopeptidase P family protein [Nitrospiraceae bacterium]|nr:MAG: aminopeptidase P family protein [Nitrospiraceae bacterium]